MDRTAVQAAELQRIPLSDDHWSSTFENVVQAVHQHFATSRSKTVYLRMHPATNSIYGQRLTSVANMLSNEARNGTKIVCNRATDRDILSISHKVVNGDWQYPCT